MTKMTDMKTPRNRLEFERNFNLLREQAYQGKLHFVQGTMHVVDSLKKVQKLPNGRIDLLTINESARLQANTMNTFANMMNFELSSKDETE
ncbi:AVAST type 1 anti-phage system protein Avs1c [Thalassomonas sp. RHCl1]|uniref:AVAST type 1 anti-phage system protein Avs1c n=1 Tax=Thalassomonas sp. RHCl1 TaxID=2995320 RepID=UPI00248BE260|nr:AVAST type 1 anti-phage system protein Avs1c [Thalassomonas sp. RHCl1]